MDSIHWRGPFRRVYHAVIGCTVRHYRQGSGGAASLLLGLLVAGCDIDPRVDTGRASGTQPATSSRRLSPEEADRFWKEFTLSGRSGREYQQQAQQPLPLVEELYELGAVEVWVDGTQYSTQVVVEFPESAVERQALIDRLTSEANRDEPSTAIPRNVGRNYYGVYLAP